MKRTEIVDRYAKQTGCDLSGIGFYRSLRLEVAVMLQQIYYHITEADMMRFAEFDQRVAGLADVAVNLSGETSGC
jgi:hypothetical protein